MSPTQLLGIVLIAPFAALVLISFTDNSMLTGRSFYIVWALLTALIVGLSLLIGGK